MFFFVILTLTRTGAKDGKTLKCGLRWDAPSTLAGEDERIRASATQPFSFLGESYDISLLVKYKHHVARYLWSSEVSKRRIFDIE